MLFPALSQAQLETMDKLLSSSYEVVESTRYNSQIRKAGTYIYKMELLLPRANKSPKALAAVNPNLPLLLNDFTKLIETSEVSSRFKELYERKISYIKKGNYSTAHNYSDCETALRLKHPETGRIALWVQGDMDVVTDGSDPVRSPKIDDYNLARTSDWYLPRTSYSWVRKSSDPKNPFLDYYPSALKELQSVRNIILEKQKADPGVVWREVLETVDSQIYRVKARGLGSSVKTGLAQRRNLLATEDPFVVLPIPWVNKSAAWSPQMGDYAAVIYKNKIYPAILGDSGPYDKVGEASLKIARAINPNAHGKERAVSDVTVSYIFFPRTATPRGVPDHALWRKKVAELLDDIGGISSPDRLHTW